MLRNAIGMAVAPPAPPASGPKPLTQAEIDKETMRMKRARTLLLIKHPFFGYLAAKLKLVASEQYDTLATDGVHCFFNPRFTAILEDDQTLTGFVHEVMHCAAQHFDREGTREPVRWRKAADYAINPTLVKSGFKPIVVPGKFEWLCDMKYDKQTAESIYDQLPPEPPGGGNAGCIIIKMPGNGNGGKDQKDPQTGGGAGTVAGDPNAPPPPPPPVNWKRALVEAAQFAKVRGKLPGHIEEMIDKIVHPKVDWKKIIRSAFSSAKKTDWTLRRPNRRYLHQGIILPTPFGYTTSVEWWGDTSGSVGADFFAMGLGAAVDIARQFKIRLDCGVCDAAVQGFWPNVKDTEIIKKIRFLGRGGTDFRPIFRDLKESKRKPDCIVIVTDLCGSFPAPDEKPPCQVLWLTLEAYKEMDVPFGRKVIVSNEELAEFRKRRRE